ncbi:hypothetical protein DL96DRAFT_1711733 [Flagelloscypha sp. PMI_526]|nr:hypothetical protein DL96DRAFT_1711733 [Flagelloscypha sp. PMI_526]
MFVPLVTLLWCLPYLVLAKTQYYIDDTNSTAWKFQGFKSRVDGGAFGGTVHFDTGGSVGTLTFRGSSIEIYGTKYTSNCGSIDFSWPQGFTSYQYPDSDHGSNVLFARAEGFSVDEISYLSFSGHTESCGIGGGLDYAIVYVDESSQAGSSNMFTRSEVKRLIRIFFGLLVGVLGGIVIVLVVLVSLCYILLGRRKERKPPGEPMPMPEWKSGHPSPISSPTSGGARQLDNASNAPPWPQPQP